MMRFKFLCGFILAAFICGCAGSKDFKKPQVDVPTAWRTDSQGTGAVDSAWWEQFNDSTLVALIQEGLTNNQDIRIATARIKEYYGRLGVVRSQAGPQVGATASSGRAQSPGAQVAPGGKATSDSFEVKLAASWELDLFGRVRSQTEAARAQLKGAQEVKTAAILSLVTAIANSYVELLALDQKLSIAQKTETSRQEALKFIKLRFDGGIGSQVDVDQAKTELAQAQISVIDLKNTISQQENSLCALLGRNPSAIVRSQGIDQLQIPQVPAGIPSDVLEQRPDIRQAVDNLMAAHALIKAAKAQYFPVISLTGSVGSRSNDLASLFSSGAGQWGVAEQLAQPIFTSGRTRSQVNEARAGEEEMVAQYQKAVQNAFKEVNDALIDYEGSSEKLGIQKESLDSLREYARLARARYDEGMTSYLEVLDAERSLYDGEISYVETKKNIFVSLVDLYKVLGGGWVEKAEDMIPKS
ncbi:MAG TPA: efflux transporter outer membrane subunit [Candidatus Omnitrophota bacterium]|nr:efflux transporter outer membrane subunit [Candidatus Omnitrophota bacterium]HPD84252.1 efflux transporter outer membrane subunit [Candidatus Omnitrophota bacterium]HRZ03108.1 efflux transporter outer membrane subunit [Candidatus Omnitrophota bacterium]